MTRPYPPDIESRPGYFRTGVRAPWNVYRIGWSGLREDDRRYAVVFDPNEAKYLVIALNLAVDSGLIPPDVGDHRV